MILIVLFALSIGATARIVRFVSADDLTMPFRQWIFDKSNGGWLYTLITCPWCLGFWVSSAVIMTAYFSIGSAWFVLPAAILTCSHAVGLLASLDRE